MKSGHILLVTPTSEVAEFGVRCLAGEVSKLKVVRDFHAAKAELDRDPAALLVTELKLGAYNGLHLALRAQDTDTPSVLLGSADPALESIAREHGVDYLTIPAQLERLRSLALQAMAAVQSAAAAAVKWPETAPVDRSDWFPKAPSGRPAANNSTDSAVVNIV